MENVITTVFVALGQLLLLRVPTPRGQLPKYRSRDIVARFDAEGPFPVAVRRRHRDAGDDELVDMMAFGLVVGYRRMPMGRNNFSILVQLRDCGQYIPVCDMQRPSLQWWFDLYHPGNLDTTHSQEQCLEFAERLKNVTVEGGNQLMPGLCPPAVQFMPIVPPPLAVRGDGGAGGAGTARAAGGAGTARAAGGAGTAQRRRGL